MKNRKAKGASGGNTPVDASVAAKGERVQKVLARMGLGSRREIERWIQEGRVKINGRTAVLGNRIESHDIIKLNDRVVNCHKRVTTRVLLYHKPCGEVVTRRDPEGRETIFTQLPKLREGRWIAVGRLDVNTQGLLLVTNNGELANRLMHPSYGLVREYAVRVYGEVSDETLERLRKGVPLEDGIACFDSIEAAGGEGSNRWYRVSVKQGQNRIVRRLWESQNLTVSRLIRIRYGQAVLPGQLKARTFYELDEKELVRLLQSVGLESSAD